MTTTFTRVKDGRDATPAPVPLTEAAARASDPRTLPDIHSEFCRPGDLRRLFGITRSTGYNMMAQGLIASVSLRRKGQARSIRLISVPSVRAYLNRLLTEQAVANADSEVSS